jgi:hypothetical protein
VGAGGVGLGHWSIVGVGLVQGPVYLDPVDVDGFRDSDLQRSLLSSSSGRSAIGRGWYLRDRVGLGRKAELIGAGDQVPRFGV